MRSSSIIVYVADRSIEQPVLGVAGCNGDGRFVTPKYDWNKQRTVRIGILRNNILENISATMLPWTAGQGRSESPTA